MFLRVNGVDVKTPNEFNVSIYDVSAPDSGRDIQGLMWKNTIGQKRTIGLRWNYLRPSELKAIMDAFTAQEYFSVTYHDPDNVSGMTTKTFYLGDRSAPLYNWTLQIYESLSFNIIER